MATSLSRLKKRAASLLGKNSESSEIESGSRSSGSSGSSDIPASPGAQRKNTGQQELPDLGSVTWEDIQQHVAENPLPPVERVSVEKPSASKGCQLNMSRKKKKRKTAATISRQVDPVTNYRVISRHDFDLIHLAAPTPQETPTSPAPSKLHQGLTNSLSGSLALGDVILVSESTTITSPRERALSIDAREVVRPRSSSTLEVMPLPSREISPSIPEFDASFLPSMNISIDSTSSSASPSSPSSSSSSSLMNVSIDSTSSSSSSTSSLPTLGEGLSILQSSGLSFPSLPDIQSTQLINEHDRELTKLRQENELLRWQLHFREQQVKRLNPKVEMSLYRPLFAEHFPPDDFVGNSSHNRRGLFLPSISWLSFLAVLAYCPPMEVHHVTADLWPRRHLPTPSALTFFSDPATDTWAFGYYYPATDEVALSFRGTISDENWKTNFNIKLDTMALENGPWKHNNFLLRDLTIHAGFNRAFLSIWDQIKAFITKFPKTTTFSITGHSLGGALASICYLYLTAFYPQIHVEQVVTFGQPRCGTDSVGRFLKAHGRCSIIRIRNESDAVPLIPPKRPLGFSHLTHCQYLLGDGSLVQNRPRKTGTTTRGILGANAISDHSMELYCRRLNRGIERLMRLRLTGHSLPTTRSMRIIIKAIDRFKRLPASGSYSVTIQSSNSEWIKASTIPAMAPAGADEILFGAELVLYPVWPGDMFLVRFFKLTAGSKRMLGFATFAVHEFRSVPELVLPFSRGKGSKHVGAIQLSYHFSEPSATPAHTSTSFFGRSFAEITEIRLPNNPAVRALHYPAPDILTLLLFALVRRVNTIPNAFFTHVCNFALDKLKSDIDQLDLSYFLMDDPPLPGLVMRVLYDWIKSLPSPITGVQFYNRWVALAAAADPQAYITALLHDLGQQEHRYLPFLIMVLARLAIMAHANTLFTGVVYEDLAAQLRPLLFYVQHPVTGEKLHLIDDISALERGLVLLFQYFTNSAGLAASTWPISFPASLGSAPLEFANAPINDTTYLHPSAHFPEGLVVSLNNAGILTFYNPSQDSPPFYWTRLDGDYCLVFSDACSGTLFVSGASPLLYITEPALHAFSFSPNVSLPLEPYPGPVPSYISRWASIDQAIWLGTLEGEIHQLQGDEGSVKVVETGYGHKITQIVEHGDNLLIADAFGHLFKTAVKQPAPVVLLHSLADHFPQSSPDDIEPGSDQSPSHPIFSPFGAHLSDSQPLDPFPVTSILAFDDRIWVCAGGALFMIDAQSYAVTASFNLPNDAQAYMTLPFSSHALVITGSARLYRIDTQTLAIDSGPLNPGLHPFTRAVTIKKPFHYGQDQTIWIQIESSLVIAKIDPEILPNNVF